MGSCPFFARKMIYPATKRLLCVPLLLLASSCSSPKSKFCGTWEGDHPLKDGDTQTMRVVFDPSGEGGLLLQLKTEGMEPVESRRVFRWSERNGQAEVVLTRIDAKAITDTKEDYRALVRQDDRLVWEDLAPFSWTVSKMTLERVPSSGQGN